MSPADALGAARPAGHDALHALLAAATQRLLGDTITVTDEQWRAASRLPTWSRGHVATHLARQAEALGRLVSGALSGRPQTMYGSAAQRDAEIDAGAARSGLELQVDLDTTAGALADAFDAVDATGAWDEPVELRGGVRVPVHRLPLARLSEVVLHHLDLDLGLQVDDIDDATTELLLEWAAFRLQRDDMPRLSLAATSGFSVVTGTQGQLREVRGTGTELLGWLTGRGGTPPRGAEDVSLPAF